MTCTNLPPRTGQQFPISHGDYHAVVTELGATLRKLTYQGEDIIVSPGPDDMVTCCHGQLLIPFPNRIENGEYTFEGKTYTLPIDEHERHNAIHGYGKRAFWKLVSLKEDAVTLSWRAPNMEGYPFDIVVTATYSLADDGLHLNISAYNNGDADAPWALAIHPWLANGFNGYGDEIDAHNAKCSLTVPGRTHVTVNENLIPTGTEPVDGTKYDLRKDTLLTEQPFDDASTVSGACRRRHRHRGVHPSGRQEGACGRRRDRHLVPGVHRHRFPGHRASGRSGGGTADGIRERVQHRQGPHRHQAGRDVKHGAVHRDARLI